MGNSRSEGGFVQLKFLVVGETVWVGTRGGGSRRGGGEGEGGYGYNGVKDSGGGEVAVVEVEH